MEKSCLRSLSMPTKTKARPELIQFFAWRCKYSTSQANSLSYDYCQFVHNESLLNTKVSRMGASFSIENDTKAVVLNFLKSEF